VLTAEGYSLASLDRCSERFGVTCRRYKDIIRRLLGWRLLTQQQMGLLLGQGDDQRLDQFYKLILPGDADSRVSEDRKLWSYWPVVFSAESLVDKYEPSAAEKAYLWMAYQFCCGRKVFYYRELEIQSPRNLRFGLCPNDAREGDLLCGLLGCRYPVILHPQDNCYTVVGEAFVPEYMMGRALEGTAQRLRSTLSFTIC
jgi:hypothetical protein